MYGEPINCRAKADGCSENHFGHYCRLCDENDSDHLSRNCPQAITLYHGTKADAATNITEEGLKCSPGGRLGPGIYFVDNRVDALKIARSRNPNNWAVLQCRVNIGPPIAGNTTERLHGTVGVHPPWAGITTDFTEYCLTNEKKCNVVEKISKNGEFIIMNKNAIPKGIDQILHARDFPARQPAVMARQPAAVQWQVRQPTFVAPWQIQAAPKRTICARIQACLVNFTVNCWKAVTGIIRQMLRCLDCLTANCGKCLVWSCKCKTLKHVPSILILLSFILHIVNAISCIVLHVPGKLKNDTVQTVPRDIQNSYISFSVFCVLHIIGSITLLVTCLFTDKWNGMETCRAILYQLGKYALLDMPMYVSHACLIKFEMKFKGNENWDPYFWDLLLQLGFFIETIIIILVMVQATRRYNYKIIAFMIMFLLSFYFPVWLEMSRHGNEYSIDPSDLVGTFTEGGRSHNILVFLCFIGVVNLGVCIINPSGIE